MESDPLDTTPVIQSPKTVDPVCGMTVSRSGSAAEFEFNGQKYFFCSRGCAEKFALHPQNYLPVAPNAVAKIAQMGDPLQTVDPAQTSGWTCPMHPEIRQLTPGNCPKCGMALQPVDLTDDAGSKTELDQIKQRVLISAILTAPVVVLAMSAMIPGQPLSFISESAQNWIQFGFTGVIIALCGSQIFARAYQSLLHRSANMFTLIALGISVAFLYSAVKTAVPGSLNDNGHGVYFESAAVITTLVLIGQMLEAMAMQHTGSTIAALLKMSPKTAYKVEADGSEHEVAIGEILIGDRVRVQPGQTIPVDGIIVFGAGVVDQSMVTGETLPVEKQKEDAVIGSTTNSAGSFVMRATRVGSETVLAQIIEAVKQGQRSRIPMQKTADVISSYFVPTVLVLSLITFLFWNFAAAPELRHLAIVNAVAVLIVACPCALGLAAPMAVMAGTGRGAAAGILFRNAESLQKLGQIKCLVVDKTGTLTSGRPEIISVIAMPPYSLEDGLSDAAAVERGSEHPLARAVLKEAQRRTLEIKTAINFQSTIGSGVSATVDGQLVEVKKLNLESIKDDAIRGQAAQLQLQGCTLMLVERDSQPVAILAAGDKLKQTSLAAAQELRLEQIEIVLATGDHATTAKHVAAQLQIETVEAQLSPEDKQRLIVQLQAQGQLVAMAGDGINDAPALATADVGIAMGKGTDVAINAADMVLVSGDLMSIVRAIKLSRALVRNVKENLWLAFAYNVISIPIAMGVLYPATGLLLNPMIASVAMSLSSISVILNSLRLQKIQL